MSTTYVFVPVPLDAGSAADNPKRFAVHLLSTIRFDAGKLSSAEILAAVRNHPLLDKQPPVTVPALALRYSDFKSPWLVTKGAAGVTDVTLSYSGVLAFDNFKPVLEDYLRRPGPVPVAPFKHDAAPDARKPEQFVDPAGMHERIALLRGMIQEKAASRFVSASLASLEDWSDTTQNYARRHFVNGQSQGALIELLFGDAKPKDLGLGPEGARLIAELRADTDKFRLRLHSSDVSPDRSRALKAVVNGQEEPVDPRDPNAAMHAALSNGLIAQRCGIATEWIAQSEEPLIGDYVLTLDPAAFDAGAHVECKVTALRRNASTHPLSFVDVGQPSTSNGGLASLNDPKGRSRYSATSVNAEMAAVQATILQAGNSLANGLPVQSGAVLATGPNRRDDRPPSELAQQQFGFNELEAAGLTISAPAVDLATPQRLASETRETDLPCLFLEDLWSGFRLDLAVGSKGTLKSTHRQTQRVTFGERVLEGECEDYWPRESANVEPGKFSTEILRYNGLSAAQNADYAAFVGLCAPEPPSPGAPFEVTVTGACDVTRLLFGDTPLYRLRNVFQGGISLRHDDPSIASPAAQYLQNAPFYRARAFKAGEIVAPSDGAVSRGDAPLSIFLTKERPERRILIAPSPVDPDTARYNGQFLADHNEAKWDAERAFVTDLPTYLKTAGRDALYYCDPGVNLITVELRLRNGNPSVPSQEFHFEDGIYCEVIQPYDAGRDTARFANSNRWRDFKPIEILFQTTGDRLPKLKVENRGRKVRVTLPVAADVELVLTPVLAGEAVRRTASFAPSNRIATLVEQGFVPGTVAAMPVVEHRIRAVHCASTPLAAPVLVSETNSAGEQSAPVAILKREPSTDRAELVGYVNVDAASTGEVQIEGAWSEIDDDPSSERYALKAGRNASKPRSLRFSEYVPPGGAAAARWLIQGQGDALMQATQMIGQQCAENRLFMGGARPVSLAPAKGDVPACVLTLGNNRRARLELTATAKGRYAANFTQSRGARLSLSSKPIAADVPASMPLAAPAIDHVVPLVHQSVEGDRNSRTRLRLYAFRIYVRRPWFLSGPGERLAVACHTGRPPHGKQDTLNKLYTQWGEDPVARAKIDASLRLPRATDFLLAETPKLDPILYPRDGPEGSGGLLRFDDVIRDADDPTNPEARLSLASYALQWDGEQKLWFCDVRIAGDFSGWIGLALYRHQPHAHEGYQLSRSPAFAYSLVLQGERVTWIKQQKIVSVTIGPVFDASLNFEAEHRRYSDGVSAIAEMTGRFRFSRYQVGEKIYFEGRFPIEHDGIEIVRQRFGEDIGSFRLEVH